jgi:hypothetical protein
VNIFKEKHLLLKMSQSNNGVVGKVDPRLNNPDNVYLDASITNNHSNITIPASYSTTRNVNIIDSTSDYYLSVARFVIPNDNIPLFVFRDDTYLITISNGGVESSRYVAYIPSSSDPDERFIYTIQSFLNMVNATIALCCADVGIAEIPVAYLDKNTNLQGIRFSNNANWLGSTAAVWQMWFNWPLFYFFKTMEHYYAFNFDLKSYLIVVQNQNNGNVRVVSGVTYYFMEQETDLLSLYVTVHSIIVATTGVPVEAELISFRTHGANAGEGSSETFNIITDFVPGESANYSENFTPYVYIPNFYRLVNLKKGGGLNKFDFQIFYSDIYQNVYPINLLPYQRITVKFAFVKKSLYSNAWSN